MKKLFIPLVVLLGIGMNAIAQESVNATSANKPAVNTTSDKPTTGATTVAATASKKEAKGDKFSFVYAYDKAIDKYSRSKTLTIEGQRSLAYSYHMMDQNIKSEEAYAKLVNTPGGTLAEDYYNYAMVLKINGKYDESDKMMQKFVEQKPNDLRGKDFTANKDKFTYMLKDVGNYKIVHQDINTDALDFGASFYKDKVVFASTRSTGRMIQKNYNWTRKPFWDMYVATPDKEQLTKVRNFSRKLNGKLHDGPASFNKDATFMAYTRSNYDAKKGNRVVELQIFFSTLKDDKWSKPDSFYLNSLDYSVGQPNLSADGKTMYFTSDMPGGYGGSDIYRTTKDVYGNWGKAENLGDKINTEGDEMYPFFEGTNEVLFFSSTGRFGLGGLDIFIAPADGSGFRPAMNAGYPLNSQFDDFAAITNNKMSNGYFTSNRTNGSGGDDIYYTDILNLDIGKKIKGNAMDINGNHLSNSFVKLLDDQGNLIDTLTTGIDGDYTFFVASNKNFKLIGKKEAFNDGDTTASTFGKEFVVKADLVLLRPEVKKEPIAEKSTAVVSPVILNTVYFDLDKSNIRPDAKAQLDLIVKIMNENPDMKIELSSYCDCRESDAYNQILSNKREKASSDYIKARISKPERITGKGYGKTDLVNGCACDDNIGATCTEEQHQKNRRTEFIIVK